MCLNPAETSFIYEQHVEQSWTKLKHSTHKNYRLLRIYVIIIQLQSRLLFLSGLSLPVLHAYM